MSLPSRLAPLAGWLHSKHLEQKAGPKRRMSVTSKSITTTMKINTVLAGIAGVLLFSLATSTPARAESEGKGKEVTIKGEAKCAKCSLHEADKCQTVIQTKEDGKTVTYWVTQNDIAKDFHKEVCQDSKKVKAMGKVVEADGKKKLTLEKITPET
jgi:hypothetical protein